MGDNRDESFDSRRFGPIPIDHVIGRAFVVIWPLSRFGGL
jgi:signal peptidase I